jgi:hypothetical protein
VDGEPDERHLLGGDGADGGGDELLTAYGMTPGNYRAACAG